MSTVSRKRFEVMTGLSPSRLQRWCESGILRPWLVGRRRRFSETDALTARLMTQLTRRGQSPALAAPTIRQAVKQITASPWWAKRPTASVAADDLIMIVYAHEKWSRPTAVVVRRDGALEEIRQHRGPGYLLDVAEIAAPIRSGWRYFRP